MQNAKDKQTNYSGCCGKKHIMRQSIGSIDWTDSDQVLITGGEVTVVVTKDPCSKE